MVLLPRIGLALLLVLPGSLTWAGKGAPPAKAAPARSGADQEARRLYQAGEAAFTAGRFVEAVQSFQAAYEQSHAPKLLWNIAQSWRRQYDVSGDVADLRRARAVLQNFRELADSEAERTEAVTALAQVEAAIEGEEAKARAAAAAASGAAANAAASPPAPAPQGPSPEQQATRARTLKAAGLAVGAAGLALTAAGGVMVFLGQRAFSQIDTPAPGYVFDPDTESRSRVFRPAGWALVGVGVAALAGGVTAYVLGGRADKPRVSLAPSLAPGHAGLALSGAF